MRSVEEWSRIKCSCCKERQMCDQVPYDCPREDPPMKPEADWRPKKDEPVWLLGRDQLGTKMWIDGITEDTIALRSIANGRKFLAARVFLPKEELGNRIFKTAKAMKAAAKAGAPFDR